jgi:hypothetical protein
MKAKRVIKKTGKILLLTILSLVFILILLVIIALHSENTITKLALKEVSKMIEAPVKVDNVSLLLFRKFPYATVQFDGFKLGAHKKSEADTSSFEHSDTLVSLRKLYVSLKTRPLLKSKIVIQKIEIEGLSLNYFVDSTGASNMDFLMGTDSTAVEEPIDTSETLLDLLLRDLAIRDITINYDDRQMKASACIQIPEVEINGKILNAYYSGNIKGKAILTKCSLDGTNLHLMNESTLSFVVGYVDGAVNIESLVLKTDGAKVNAIGKATLGDSIYVDMGVSLHEVNLKELSKYATEDDLNEFGLIGVSGQMDISTRINGYVYDTLLLPQVKANISLKRGSIATKDYPEIKHISFTGAISAPNPNDLSTVSVDFKDFRIATPKSYFDLAFNASNLDKPKYDVKARGKVNFDEFSSFIPDSTVEYLTGTMAFNMTTRGVLPDNVGMESADYFLDRTNLEFKLRNFSTALDSIDEVKNLTGDFAYKSDRSMAISNLSLEAPGYGVALKNSSFKGKLLGLVSDMDNMGFDFDSFYIQMGNNIFEGNAVVNGLEDISFSTNTKMSLVLEELIPFMPDSLVEHLSGKLQVELSSYGKVHLDSIEEQAMKIAFEQTRISAKAQGMNIEMFDDTLTRVKNLSLDFRMTNDTIRIDNLVGHAHGIDFWMDSTEIWNVYKAFLLEQKDQTIIVNTHLKVSDIEYAKFAYLVEGDSTQTDIQEPLGEKGTGGEVSEEMYIPPFIARGTLAATSVKYDDILLKNLFTYFRVDDSLYVLDKFKLEAFGGSMISSLVYDTRKGPISTIQFKNEIFGMDVNQMLIDGKNFDQEEFTHENIKGILTSSVDGRVELLNDTTVLYDKINLRGNFKLVNGGIYNFEPVMELGRFTNLRELDNIVFRTLESSVFIYNNNIYFPKTDIVSTAIDISAMGMQSFDEDYQYHLTVYLSDVLLGKSSRLLKEQGMEKDGFEGEDESSRRGLYLVSLNRNGETKHGFDNKRLQRNMNATIRVQERGLSLIFHPRLVNFSTELDRKER